MAERTAVVPDVMQGIAEVLKLVTGAGDAGHRQQPGLPAFLRLHRAHGAAHHRGAAGGGSPARPGRDRGGLPDRHGRGAPRPLPAVQPAQSDRHRAHGRRADRCRRAGQRTTGCGSIVDEIHAPLVLPGRGSRAVPRACPARDGISMMSASKAWNLAGLKAAVAIAGPDAADDLARMPGGGEPRPEPPRRASPTPPRCAGGATGSTRCWPGWTTTGGCWATCSPSTCPRCATGRRRRRSWPGSTAAPSTWATTPSPSRARPPLSPARRRSSWSVAGWP